MTTFIEISDYNDLKAVDNDLTADYELVNDIDASASETDPLNIGSDSNIFTGVIEGNGYTISNLWAINGLLRAVGGGGEVRNLILSNVDIDGRDGNIDHAGAVIGRAFFEGTFDIKNVDVSGVIDSAFGSGGLAGISRPGGSEKSIIEDCNVDVTLTADTYCGGLVADAETTDISKCHVIVDGNGGSVGGILTQNRADCVVKEVYVEGSVIGDGFNTGGLVATPDNILMEDCAFVGTVDGGATYLGGGIGEVSDETVHRCFVVPFDLDQSTAGSGKGAYSGVIWDENDGTHEYLYADYDESDGANVNFWGDGNELGDTFSKPNTGYLDKAEMTGEAAETHLETFDFDNVWTTTDEYPILQFMEEQIVIMTRSDLEDVDTNLGGDHILGADIDLAGANWAPLAQTDAFTGTFEGDGYTIKNMTVADNHVDAGLFSVVDEGVFNNMVLENVDVQGTETAGGLAGKGVLEASEIRVTGDISAPSAGGLVGIVEEVGGS